MTLLLTAALGLQPTLTTGVRRAGGIASQIGREVLHILDVLQPGIPCDARQCDTCDRPAITKLTAGQAAVFAHRPDPNKTPDPTCGLGGCPGELHRVLDLGDIPRFARWEES